MLERGALAGCSQVRQVGAKWLSTERGRGRCKGRVRQRDMLFEEKDEVG